KTSEADPKLAILWRREKLDACRRHSIGEIVVMWRFLRNLFHRTPPVPELVHDTPAEFAADAAPDWLLEWELAILPGGGRYCGRLPLSDKAEAATASVEYPASHRRPVAPRPVGVSAVVIGHLLRALASFPEHLLTVEPQCYDGMPLSVTVHRRGSGVGVRAQCNLGDAFGLLAWPRSTASVLLSDEIERMEAAGTPLAPVFQIGFILWDVSAAVERGTV